MEDKILFSLPRVEPRFPGRPGPVVVTSVTELSGCRNVSSVLHSKYVLYAPSLENHCLKLHTETGVKHSYCCFDYVSVCNYTTQTNKLHNFLN